MKDTISLNEEIVYKGRKNSSIEIKHTSISNEKPVLIRSFKRNIHKQTQSTDNPTKKMGNKCKKMDITAKKSKDKNNIKMIKKIFEY